MNRPELGLVEVFEPPKLADGANRGFRWLIVHSAMVKTTWWTNDDKKWLNTMMKYDSVVTYCRRVLIVMALHINQESSNHSEVG